MNPRLDENETVLGILVLAVALKVLADGDGLYGRSQRYSSEEADREEWKRRSHLLDEVVEVLGELGGEAYTDISLSAVTNRGIHRLKASVGGEEFVSCGMTSRTSS